MKKTPGRLKVNNQGNIQIKYKDQNDNSKSVGIGNAVLTKSLYDEFNADPNKLKDRDVEFELDNGQPCRVCPVGEEFQDTPRPKTVKSDHFHNPYNFVPAPRRDKISGNLADGKPVGHGRYHHDRWTGRIAVKLTTITPLLIPDAAEMEEDQNGHKTFPVRVDANGKPYLPPTSLKGMLRSAYEAVTNSRFSVLDPHDARLAYRMPATLGLQMVPARVENGELKLYPGTSEIGSDGKPIGPMYAAWLPFYRRRGTELTREVTYPDRSLPQHGDRVTFWAEKFEKQNRDGNPIFSYWKVRAIAKTGQQLGAKPSPSSGNGAHQPAGEELRQFSGFVYISNKNIDNKHDERVFFTEDEPISHPLTEDLKRKWTELITNYQDIHKDDIRKGWTAPPALNNALWSRQVVGGAAERRLFDESLCYAHVQKGSVRELYPVMITRGLYGKSPISLLHKSLRPTTNPDKSELSPADRVFGWVNQKGKGSYKGHLRVHSVTCNSDDPIDDFGGLSVSVPLAILGQPKPQQFRFYSAQDNDGTPLSNGSTQESGYKSENQGLRGRKVYPHHQGLPNNYWDNPQQDRTQNAVKGHYQEYRRPKKGGAEQRDDQNRSMKSWVKVGTEFTFDIDVTNLSDVELGALLYLLTLPDIHFHRLGGGKSLGFGSVRLDWEKSGTDLRKGEDWSEFYQTLLPDDIEVEAIDVKRCVRAYQDAVKAAYGNGKAFEEVPFIAAFCRCAKGFDDNAAVRYPRVTQEPTPEGEAFKWFVDNEQDTREELGLKLVLPDLASPTPESFPIHPKKAKS